MVTGWIIAGEAGTATNNLYSRIALLVSLSLDSINAATMLSFRRALRNMGRPGFGRFFWRLAEHGFHWYFNPNLFEGEQEWLVF